MLKLRTVKVVISAAILIPIMHALASQAQQTNRQQLDTIEQQIKPDVPRFMCLDDQLATGGQPNDSAYAKVAASGFRSVLSLRSTGEGVDLFRERAIVEQSKLRYFNIPVVTSAPRAEQADEFLRLVKDASNHPMLINCASANRVGAFMMIYRVLEQGWSEEKALDEAVKIGTTTESLKKFARDYIAQHKNNRG